MLMRGSAEDNNQNPILHFTFSLFNSFHKMWFSLSCLGVQVVFDYKFCLYRQLAFGKHSSLPVITLLHVLLYFCAHANRYK